jgi:glycosyltransferase involved in cell wall biosynthesis
MGEMGQSVLKHGDEKPAQVSVAICTYNRCKSLPKTLESLIAMDKREGAWELLVIDNNSSDGTAEIVQSYSNRLPVKYFFEDKQGLSHARNRALKECAGDLLIFIDDDVLVSKEWFGAYASASIQYPNAGFFGGKILPYWPQGRPGWVEDESMPLIGGLLGHYDLGSATRLYAENEMHPFGANFALHRHLFERLSPFNPDFGVLGETPGRGEEAEYFQRARAQGSIGVYVGEALCLHAVNPDHLSLKFLYRFGVQKGLAHARLTDSVSDGNLSTEVVFLVKGIYQLLKGHGDRFRQCVVNMGMERGLRIKGKQT